MGREPRDCAVDLATTPVVLVTVTLVLILSLSGLAGRLLLHLEPHITRATRRIDADRRNPGTTRS